jgi:hypothetical protein
MCPHVKQDGKSGLAGMHTIDTCELIIVVVSL